MNQDFPPIARVRFRLETTEPARLPPYAGSAWRGLLGHSLRRTVCVTRQPTCDGCMLAGTCAYSVFFESPPSSPESAQHYTALPHPFVLDVGTGAARDFNTGATLTLGINLIGPAIDLLPYLVQSMIRAGQRGIGRDGGRFALREVTAEQHLGSDDWHTVYDPDSDEYRRVSGDAPAPSLQAPGSVALNLQTPLRIKRHGRFVGATEFEAGDFLRHLSTRLASLARLYGGDECAWQFARGKDEDSELRLGSADLHWSEWTRFSSRQNTKMQMGGLVGQLVLNGPGLERCWPAIWLGQWTHVGKGTSFGLGKYRVQCADD